MRQATRCVVAAARAASSADETPRPGLASVHGEPHGPTNPKNAAKVATAYELDIARREIERLITQLTAADDQAALQPEPLQADLEAHLEGERRIHKNQPSKLAAEGRADIDAARRERQNFTAAIDLVPAESARAVTQLERLHRLEVGELATRIRAGSGTMGSPPVVSPQPRRIHHGDLEMRTVRAELDRLKQQIVPKSAVLIPPGPLAGAADMSPT
jgi:hypothetical protein